METSIKLPSGVSVFERGWLSANNILITGKGPASLIDSGYCTHSQQTIELVARALEGRPLEMLLNTHLHSDHCGGNAALQAAYPALQTLIPPGHAEQVRTWDAVALTYVPTGQLCPQFQFDGVLLPGTSIELGDHRWDVHAAAGHDPHSVILFEPLSRTLVSADALWQNGFGVVFPELEGLSAFDEVGATLDLIESLAPAVVIPGHGPIFADIGAALAIARKRLAGFVGDPARHARYAAKVLVKYKLLERQRFERAEFQTWALDTAYLQTVRERWEPDADPVDWLDALLSELATSGALRLEDGAVLNV